MRYLFITLISIALCSCGINKHVEVDYNDELGTRRATKKEEIMIKILLKYSYRIISVLFLIGFKITLIKMG